MLLQSQSPEGRWLTVLECGGPGASWHAPLGPPAAGRRARWLSGLVQSGREPRSGGSYPQDLIASPRPCLRGALRCGSVSAYDLGQTQSPQCHPEERHQTEAQSARPRTGAPPHSQGLPSTHPRGSLRTGPSLEEPEETRRLGVTWSWGRRRTCRQS